MAEYPGFVDAHSHDDLALLDEPDRAVKRRQGIVHQVIGNCGLSPFPRSLGRDPNFDRFLTAVLGPTRHVSGGVFEDAADFLSAVPRNVSVLLGYNTLRSHLFGSLARPLDGTERSLVIGAIRRAVEAGACGVSLGMAYLPVVWSGEEELIAVVGATPLLTTHIRNESSHLIESIEEVARLVSLARQRGADCRLHVSHLKIAGRRNFHLLERLLATVKRLHDEIGLTFDHYPFAFGSTGLAAVLPPEFAALPPDQLEKIDPGAIDRRLDETDWENYVDFAGAENLVLVGLVHRADLNGTPLERRTCARLVRDLVATEPRPAVLIHSQSLEVIDELLRLPFGCVGSDALPEVKEHPRLTRTFPEYLDRMRRLGFTLEQAVEKAARLPRRIFGIDNDAKVKIDTERWMPIAQ